MTPQGHSGRDDGVLIAGNRLRKWEWVEEEGSGVFLTESPRGSSGLLTGSVAFLITASYRLTASTLTHEKQMNEALIILHYHS